MTEQTLQFPLTILVAGNTKQTELTQEIQDSLKSLLVGVDNLISNMPVRILTGVDSAVEQSVINVAGAKHWPLHILVPGRLETDDAIVQTAERVVALGMGEDESQPYLASHTRDDIALAFADLVVVVADEAQFNNDECLAHFLFSVAKARKPMLWLDFEGMPRVLDITQIDQATLLLLNGDKPNFDLLKNCFVDLDGAGVATQGLLKQQLLYSELYSLEDEAPINQPELEKLRDYYRPPFKSDKAGFLSKLGLGFSQNAYWGSVKNNYFPDLSWPEADDVNSVSQFERFDLSANAAATIHRRCIWILYACSTLAILSAVAGVNGFFEHEFSALWGVSEIFLLLFIVFALKLQKLNNWHGRWIAERFMAEQLRYLRMGLPLLAIPKLFSEPAWSVNSDSTKLQLQSAELWFLQKVLRAEGLPKMKDKDNPFYSLAKAPDFSTYIQSVIEDQSNYHVDTRDKLKRTHNILHKMSFMFFVATIVAVAAHFFVHSDLLLFATIGLPAIAAAFYGISTKLELMRLVNQSDLTLKNLNNVKAAFNKLKVKDMGAPGVRKWGDWLDIRYLTLEAAHIMSQENTQWQGLIEQQEPELPG